MGENVSPIIAVIFGICLGVILSSAIVACVLEVVSGNAYRQGQIDAMNGTIKYELKTMPDKTIQWVIKEGK